MNLLPYERSHANGQLRRPTLYYTMSQHMKVASERGAMKASRLRARRRPVSLAVFKRWPAQVVATQCGSPLGEEMAVIKYDCGWSGRQST